jgi:hypothetical protein
MSNRNAWGVALLAALLGSAGCSSLVPGPGTPLATAAGPRAVPPAAGSRPFLYVGGLKLSMYALGSSKPLHVAKENPMAVYRAAIALDLHGHLCEANGELSYAQLLAYDSDTLKFVRGRTGVGAFPALLADHLGYLYASTGGAGIVVYAPGCQHQVNKILHNANNAGALVFDRSGNLYSGNTSPFSSVSIYAPTKQPGHMMFVRRIPDGLYSPIALAIGPSSDLFVANAYKRSYDVAVYAPGGSKPVRRITKGINVPLALAVDSTGRLYVANNPRYGGGPSRPGWISVYAPGSSQPLRKVRVGDPVALALDPSDNLYVANPLNHSSVLVYNAGATKLLQTIKEGIAQPTALLIGPP